jgi:hypothetical protein
MPIGRRITQIICFSLWTARRKTKQIEFCISLTVNFLLSWNSELNEKQNKSYVFHSELHIKQYVLSVVYNRKTTEIEFCVSLTVFSALFCFTLIIVSKTTNYQRCLLFLRKAIQNWAYFSLTDTELVIKWNKSFVIHSELRVK